MRLSQCHSFHDFRTRAKRWLRGPVFHGIGGGADAKAAPRRRRGSLGAVGRGVQRGRLLVKALSMGAGAVGLGHACLFPVAAAGWPGADRRLGRMNDDVERDMRRIGAAWVADLSRDNLRFR